MKLREIQQGLEALGIYKSLKEIKRIAQSSGGGTTIIQGGDTPTPEIQTATIIRNIANQITGVETNLYDIIINRTDNVITSIDKGTTHIVLERNESNQITGFYKE